MFKKLIRYLPYVISFTIFLVNSTYVSYPDEFVNLIGAKSINQGIVPYKGFFDHHLPMAWYLGAVFLKVSFNSFVNFRILWAVFGFLLLVGVGRYIGRRNKDLYRYYLLFLVLFPLLTLYFWLHLYLADSLSVLFFAAGFWILFTETQEDKPNFKAVIFCSLLNFFLVFSSLTYFYLGSVLYLWQLFLVRDSLKKALILIIFSALPYLIYLFYLLLSNTWQDFYFANFIYNTSLYIDIPNYIKGRLFNPVKFALTLIYNFWGSYLPVFSTVRDLNLYLPIASLTTLAGLILLLVLITKNLPIGVLFFFLLSFSAPRSNLQKNINETDYQVGLFVILGTIASFLAIYLLKRLKTQDKLYDDLRRTGLILLTVFLSTVFIFLTKNTFDKWYLRYTQKLPSIRNEGDYASFINELINSNDYYWMGPYEPHEEFFVKKGKIAGKYISLLPQFKQNEYLRKNFIEQFDKNLPAIIVFKKDTGIYLTPAYQFGDFFLDWMKSKYTALEEINNIKILKSPTSLKLGSHLYLRNDRKDEILKKLKKNGYIQY